MNLAQVRKLVVASTGLALLVASQATGHDLTGASDQVLAVFDAAVALATSVGVYKVPNDPAPTPPAPPVPVVAPPVVPPAPVTPPTTP